ncbi:DUF2631 domain-containing protein [Gordonia sp. ABSL1-1]|uniref:DUF2631 domain-containing protein n=1 Tax=Gordonia sp. ABSL1-1 TaxID=3053923 RepID=UPI0025740E1D|nr:DUF2631 domain-containing protein [Gordonia sp. ABSL1-1]MDL9936264.1 DUF2631 domain-containing protein [Gordonia sp. ABSL1-1]
MASTDVQHTDVIDTGWVREPSEAPSARFGWHGNGAVKTYWTMTILCVIALLGMLIGNHVGHVEDIYLVAIAAGLVGLAIYGTLRNRGTWKR